MEQTAVMSYRGIDDDVIDACRRGDTDAYRMLFETYKDRVYSIAYHFTGDEAAAKDVTQQVFLKLLTNLDQFRRDAAFSTWLFRLVATACVDEHRKSRRFVPLDPVKAADRPAPGTPADERVMAGETAESVRTAVAGLRPKLRIAVLLRYFEGLSYEEMADALGCSKGTVASRLSRGHQILARRLAHLRAGRGHGGDVC
jgi:RNA polymerase sigma-70 factor (ECF subfamily)